MRKRKRYIAYGSNINLEQMAFRCPTAKVVGKGELKNYELLFRGKKGNAYATVESKEGASVPVLIWEIGLQDEKNLDVYEGYPSHYVKKELVVETSNGRETIMAYVMKDGRKIGEPNAYYLGIIKAGYRDAGFDVNRLLERVSYCREIVEREQGNERIEGQSWSQYLL